MTEYVNTFSEFNRLGIKNKFSIYLRVWYLLRHQNTEKHGGNGWLSQKETVNILSCYYKRNRIREIMKLGEESWWEKFGDGYRLFGTQTVANILDCQPGQRVEIPTESFSTIQKFRAYSYATFFAYGSSEYKNFRGKTISRKRLLDIFDISIPTQLKYEQIAEIEVERQFAYEDIPTFDAKANRILSEDEAIQEYKKEINNRSWFWDIDNDGDQEVVWQISNRYFTNRVFYKANENKRVRLVRGSDQRDGANRKPHLPLYFDHIKPLRKKLRKNDGRKFGFVKDKKTSNLTGKSIFKKETTL